MCKSIFISLYPSIHTYIYVCIKESLNKDCVDNRSNISYLHMYRVIKKNQHHFPNSQFVFTYHYFDLFVKCSLWPLFWKHGQQLVGLIWIYGVFTQQDIFLEVSQGGERTLKVLSVLLFSLNAWFPDQWPKNHLLHTTSRLKLYCLLELSFLKTSAHSNM